MFYGFTYDTFEVETFLSRRTVFAFKQLDTVSRKCSTKSKWVPRVGQTANFSPKYAFRPSGVKGALAATLYILPRCANAPGPLSTLRVPDR